MEVERTNKGESLSTTIVRENFVCLALPPVPGISVVNGIEGLRDRGRWDAQFRQSRLDKSRTRASCSLLHSSWPMGSGNWDWFTHTHRALVTSLIHTGTWTLLSLSEMYCSVFHNLEMPQHTQPLTSCSLQLSTTAPNCVMGTTRGPWGCGISSIDL